MLADNGTRLLAEDDPRALIESLFHTASELASVEVCLNYLLTPGEDRLQLAVLYGIPDAAPSGLRELDVGDSVCGTTIVGNAPIVRSSLHESTDSSSARIRSLGVRAYACFPLTYAGALIGTLSFGTTRREAFEAEELEFLHALSDQVAAAYGRARGALALRESEERLLQAAAIAGLGMFDTDLGTAEMGVNEPGRGIYGWAPDEPLTFARAQAQFHPDDRGRVTGIVRAAFERSGSSTSTSSIGSCGTDGTVRWIRVRVRVLFDQVKEERRATRCLGTFVDITDRKDADERRDRILRAEREGERRPNGWDG